MSRNFTPNNTAQTRFSSKYRKLVTGCWAWTGSLMGGRYGSFLLNSDVGKVGAHVASYILHTGRYDNALDVAHSCDNPWCVNPEHLVQMTHADNMRDSVAKCRHPTLGKVGAGNPAYKVPIEVVEILRNSTESSNKIALLYGVTGSYVRYVRRGETRRSA